MASVMFDTSHNGMIHDAQLDYYANILASASSDTTIRIWDVAHETPQLVSELRGHDGPVWQLSWSHPKYGNLLASASHDHKIFIWREEQRASWSIIFASEDHTASVNSVQFAPLEHGLHLAAGSTDGTISVLSYNPDNAFWSRKAFVAHPNGVLCVSWAPFFTPTASCNTVLSSMQPSAERHAPGGSQRIVSGGCDHQVRIWTFNDMSNDWVLAYHLKESPHLGWVRGVAWRPIVGVNGAQCIVSCSSDRKIIYWQKTDNSQWKNSQSIDMKEPVWSVSWSLTGTVLSVVSGAHRVSFFKENIMGLWIPSTSKLSDVHPPSPSADNKEVQALAENDDTHQKEWNDGNAPTSHVEQLHPPADSQGPSGFMTQGFPSGNAPRSQGVGGSLHPFQAKSTAVEGGPSYARPPLS